MERQQMGLATDMQSQMRLQLWRPELLEVARMLDRAEYCSLLDHRGDLMKI